MPALVARKGVGHGVGGRPETEFPRELEALVAPHIDSFNYFVERGLHEAVQGLKPVEITHPGTKSKLKVWFESVMIQPPARDYPVKGADNRLYPAECRASCKGYKGTFMAELCLQVDGQRTTRMQRSLGRIPIMVKSRLCHLRNLNPVELVKKKEEGHEMGGYFITNGIERIIRLLIIPRRNYIIGLHRPSFQKRGPLFTPKAIMMRCTRRDQSAKTLRLHYLSDGTASVCFVFRKQEWFIPLALVLKSLMETSDREIYERMIALAPPGVSEASLAAQRAELILREVKRLDLHTRAQCVAFIGGKFRPIMDEPAKKSDFALGMIMLQDNVLVHLRSPSDKFNLLLLMLQKLHAIVDGRASPDNPDCLAQQELLLPGHLLTIMVKDKMQEALQKLKQALQRDIQTKPEKVTFRDEPYLKRILERIKSEWDVGQKVESMIVTGNLPNALAMDLSQTAGFTIVAEKLNYLRYLSHFRSVHRGAYFMQLRTTTVRKLLPESWGFMCPVHTPDGSPCGLLNHLTRDCVVTSDLARNGREKEPYRLRTCVAAALCDLGMVPPVSALALSLAAGPPHASASTTATATASQTLHSSHLPVLLDGAVLGSLPVDTAAVAVAKLRDMKVDMKLAEVCEDLEVGLVPPSDGGAFAGLFMFSTPARMMRHVRQRGKDPPVLELIGSFEQVYMDIHCQGGPETPARLATMTHEEIHPSRMLSVVASLTPWSDLNQSPRNMYQCQMGKQTMGFPAHALTHRTDNKMYQLQTPQTPVAQAEAWGRYCMDEYPTGTNAVVAVLAYTGYDMEDAMIINKSSMERGLCHGSLFKTEVVDIAPRRGGVAGDVRFGIGPGAKPMPAVDRDGLPMVGEVIQPDDIYCSTYNRAEGKHDPHKLKGTEVAVVDRVAFIQDTVTGAPTKASIRLRINRNPIIGDKFSSRHGQKGVLSQLWPDVDMPFSEVHGIRPDIIINPHAFPSRMTIGMLVESMAAKSGSLQGKFVDATPFQPQERASAARVFGEELVKEGYSYHGTETMYSGVFGTEMDCHIYMGVVYYQRLRHMVSDKFQVRSLGPVNKLHRQPVKGRKFGGGIRFGEMERDSLLAHGASFLVRDRLSLCSDHAVWDICGNCGSLLAPLQHPRVGVGGLGQLGQGEQASRNVVCANCHTGQGVERVTIPYVFKYLVAELAAMNIKLRLDIAPS